jgi:hypothetical protein
MQQVVSKAEPKRILPSKMQNLRRASSNPAIQMGGQVVIQSVSLATTLLSQRLYVKVLRRSESADEPGVSFLMALIS